jgi:hypothetical protein
MTFTVGDLKAELESFDDEMEVRFVSQPSWPFEYSVENIVHGDDMENEKYHGKVYLVEGSQIGYASKDFWEMF